MKRFKKDLMKYRKYMVYSAKAELKAEVANSHLGWLWWILDPLLFMLVYAFVSSIVFKAKEDYFMAFIFVGVTTWEFFNKTLKQSVKLVTSNSQIVIYPEVCICYLKNGNKCDKNGNIFCTGNWNDDFVPRAIIGKNVLFFPDYDRTVCCDIWNEHDPDAFGSIC